MTTKEKSGGSKGGRPRSMQSQQAILDATLTLLATEGFDAMSIESIVAKASVGKKTIYRWWISKEELVIDAIKSLQQTKNPVIDTGSLREDLILMERNAFQAWSGPHARALVFNLLGVMTTHPEVFLAFYDQVLAPRLQQFTQVIQRAQSQGEVRQDLDPNEFIGLLAGPMWYHLFFDASNTSLAPDLPEKIVDAVLQGIATSRMPEVDGVDAFSQDVLDH